MGMGGPGRRPRGGQQPVWRGWALGRSSGRGEEALRGAWWRGALHEWLGVLRGHSRELPVRVRVAAHQRGRWGRWHHLHGRGHQRGRGHT